jgi:hypothetical protein
MSRRIRASEPAMIKNPERDGLKHINPVNKKNIFKAMDIAHRKTKPAGEISGYNHSRAYAGFSHGRQKFFKNGIPDIFRNYTGYAPMRSYRPGSGAGCGGGKDR